MQAQPEKSSVKKHNASKSGDRAEHSKLTSQREEQAFAEQPDVRLVVEMPDSTHTVPQRPITGRKIMPFLPASIEFKRTLLRPITAPESSALQPSAPGERRDQKMDEGSELEEMNSRSKKDSLLIKDFPERLTRSLQETKKWNGGQS